MTMTVYPNGYGRRDPPFPCPATDNLEPVQCPCCNGAGEHAIGAGMDSDASRCWTCDGNGVLELKRINKF